MVFAFLMAPYRPRSQRVIAVVQAMGLQEVPSHPAWFVQKREVRSDPSRLAWDAKANHVSGPYKHGGRPKQSRLDGWASRMIRSIKTATT